MGQHWRLLQRFDFEWTASRISRHSFGPFRSRRFRRCRSSSGADRSRSLSNCVEAKPRAFDLAFWVRDLAGCATASACSRRRRIASGRDNRASWRPIQASKAASWAGCNRTRIGSPLYELRRIVARRALHQGGDPGVVPNTRSISCRASCNQEIGSLTPVLLLRIGEGPPRQRPDIDRQGAGPAARAGHSGRRSQGVPSCLRPPR